MVFPSLKTKQNHATGWAWCSFHTIQDNVRLKDEHNRLLRSCSVFVPLQTTTQPFPKLRSGSWLHLLSS